MNCKIKKLKLYFVRISSIQITCGGQWNKRKIFQIYFIYLDLFVRYCIQY